MGFVQKGGSGTLLGTSFISPDGISNTDVSSTLNYISFNTLFVGKLPVGKRLVPFIQAGPRIDYMLGYSETGFDMMGQFQDLDILNKYCYGADLGAGVDIHLNRVKIGLGFDYLLNFNKIVDHTSTNGVTTRLTDHTWLLNAQVGYRF